MTASAINPAITPLGVPADSCRVRFPPPLAFVSTDSLRTAVTEPTMDFLGVRCSATEDLILGTLLAMSSLPRVKCAPDGVGPYGIPRSVHTEIWDNHLAKSPDLASRVRGLASQHCFLKNPHAELGFNLAYATAIAWAIYDCRGVVPEGPSGLAELASIWQTAYPHQGGRASDFINAWNRSLNPAAP